MPYLLAQPALESWPPYVWFDDILTAEECAQVIDWSERIAMGEAKVGAHENGTEGRVDPAVRRTRVGWLPWSSDLDWLYARLSGVCDAIRQRWYPFHLSGFVEPMQLTHYQAEVSGHYGTHRDMGGALMSARKLSLVVQLSDSADFDGGALELPGLETPNKTVTEIKRGSLVAFPAWELHRVQPVTRGERWSLVAWVHGPPFC